MDIFPCLPVAFQEGNALYTDLIEDPHSEASENLLASVRSIRAQYPLLEFELLVLAQVKKGRLVNVQRLAFPLVDAKQGDERRLQLLGDANTAYADAYSAPFLDKVKYMVPPRPPHVKITHLR